VVHAGDSLTAKEQIIAPSLGALKNNKKTSKLINVS